MSSSDSSPQNTTATTTNAQETNEAATNTQGVTLVGNSGPVALTSNTTTTDDGAVLAGTKTAQLAISANTGLSETLAGDYLNDTENTATQSASLVSNVLTQGIQFLTTSQASNNAEINSLATADATNVANEGNALSSIATANDTSQASQATTFATSALKIAAVVILGVAVIYFATRKA
jgi:hypothetical protein